MRDNVLYHALKVGMRIDMGKKLIIGIAIVVVLYFVFDRSESAPPPTTVQTPASSDEATAPSSFAGYDCTEDCSGHEAGYNWAEEHDIDDEEVCDTAGDHSNSPSFAEGCRAYVNGDSSPTSDDDKNEDEKDNDDKKDDDNAARVISARVVWV
jgi:hypothetical protein